MTISAPIARYVIRNLLLCTPYPLFVVYVFSVVYLSMYQMLDHLLDIYIRLSHTALVFLARTITDNMYSVEVGCLSIYDTSRFGSGPVIT